MGCYNSIVIDAPVEKVWAAFQNFHDLSAFPNVVENLDQVGDVPGTEIGAKRVLNGAFQETLRYFNDEEKNLRYTIDEGPGPLEGDNCQGYVGEVKLYSVTENNGTFVVWTSDWDVGGEEVADFCSPIYHALLADLKTSMS